MALLILMNLLVSRYESLHGVCGMRHDTELPIIIPGYEDMPGYEGMPGYERVRG